MNNDPIVAEVRRVRDGLARQFNYDIHVIFADLQKLQTVDDPAHPLVTDAREWAEVQDGVLTLREEPKEPGVP